MADLNQKLADDRALRNAARGLLRGDVSIIKQDVERRGIGSRLVDGAGKRAGTMADEAGDLARRNPIKLGSAFVFGTTAIAAWIYRDRIAEAVREFVDYDEGEDWSEHDDAKTCSLND